VVGASALLDRFGSVVDVIEADGFEPDAKVTMIVEGETPGTMAKSTGLGLLELPTIFGMLKPDIVVSVGDRFETMATAVAAAYMNIPLAHTMGGEISGTIDESIRHAVTKLSHLHFPANKKAGERIVRMGEDPTAVHVVGCPRIDLVADIARGMRKFREKYRPEYIRFYKNFPIETYVRLMLSCACAIGNSSAPLREGAFVGVPTVNIGTRQQGRDRAENLTDAGYDRREIIA